MSVRQPGQSNALSSIVHRRQSIVFGVEVNLPNMSLLQWRPSKVQWKDGGDVNASDRLQEIENISIFLTWLAE
jgi:hypothetical protein